MYFECFREEYPDSLDCNGKLRPLNPLDCEDIIVLEKG